MVHHRWNRARDEGGIYELDPDEVRRREAYRSDSAGNIKTGEGLFTEKMLTSMANGWREQIARSREDGRALLGDQVGDHLHVILGQLGLVRGAHPGEAAGVVFRIGQGHGRERLSSGPSR
jgi:hypothetical protein